jgi:hypothetical protein
MSHYDVEVLLSTNRRATDLGYDPSVTYQSAGTFRVSADGPEAAAEVAWTIANSYPDEMHALPRYAPDVARYRNAHHRSLSVGDAVRVDGELTYAVARFGFAQVGAPWVEPRPRPRFAHDFNDEAHCACDTCRPDLGTSEEEWPTTFPDGQPWDYNPYEARP